MIKSISNIAWSADQDEIVYQSMCDLGFDALEIAPTRLISKEQPYSKENILEAKNIVEQLDQNYGFQISSMQSIMYGIGENIFRSSADREIILKYLEQSCCYAQNIHCPNLVFGSPKNRSYKAGDSLDQGVCFFRDLANIAEKYHTTIAMEANPTIYGTNYINTTLEALQLVKEVNKEHFKINLDFGTIIYNREDIATLETILPYVNHVHISEPYLAPIQKREQHSELLERLKSNGYQKAISIEMKKPEKLDVLLNVMDYVMNLLETI